MMHWDGDSPAFMCGWEGCSLRAWADILSAGTTTPILCVQHAWLRDLGNSERFANDCSDDEYRDSLLLPDLYYSVGYYDHYYADDDWYSDGLYDDEETVLARNWYQDAHGPDEMR